jgi:hypothetical protein
MIFSPGFSLWTPGAVGILERKMRKCVMLAAVAALVASAPGLASATPTPAGGALKAAAAAASGAEKIQRIGQRARPLPYECYRFYRPCWYYGYYQFYGAWGPIGYWGLYRPYERDPWSWWKLP